MEKAAAAGASAGSHRELRFAICLAAAAAGACPAVCAQDGGPTPAERLVAQASTEPALRVQIQTSTMPRLADSLDPGSQATRIDVSLFPSSGPVGLGAMVGMSGFSARTTPSVIGLQPPPPSFDVGLRFSQRLQSQQVDISAWKRMNVDDDAYTLVQSRQPVYGARVEMNLSGGRKKGFAADLGFIGLQLESGARISLKRKDGRPMVYYRSSF